MESGIQKCDVLVIKKRKTKNQKWCRASNYKLKRCTFIVVMKDQYRQSEVIR